MSTPAKAFDAVSHRFVLERWIKKYGYTRIAEIGVKKGTTFLHILRTCRNASVIGVDPWPGAHGQYLQSIRSAVAEEFPERGLVHRGLSVEVAEKIPDGSLDLVFIDADHSEAAVRADIVGWRRKIRAGGVLCGHDLQIEGVCKAVTSLVPGFSQHEQNIWAVRCTDPRLTTAIPYANNRNLGKAYNKTMEQVPDDGWAVLLDHDVMFTTVEWHRQITRAIIERPDACFSAVTNRIKSPLQRLEGIDHKNHNIAYHREIGKNLLGQTSLRDVTDRKTNVTPSGLIFILSKQAWKEAGGFPEGLHYVDRIMWMALMMTGRPILVIDGLYLYHWHRAGGEAFQNGKWATTHTLANGDCVGLSNRTDLPPYGNEISVPGLDDEGYQFSCETQMEQMRAMSLYSKEPGTVEWLRQQIKPEDVFYDIGANIGQYAVVAAKRGARVYAFEPHMMTATGLMRNIALNGISKNVSVLTTALHGSERFADFNYKTITAGSSGSQFGSTVEEAGGEFVPEAVEIKFATTIDRLLRDGIIQPATVIKIDVDGNELEVLRGMESLLPTVRSIQVEMHQKTETEISSFLEGFGLVQIGRHISSIGQQAVDKGIPEDQVFYNAIFERNHAAA